MLGAAPLESQVVLGTDAGQQCQLLATQPGRAASPAGNQPDVFGANLVPPRTQVISQRVGSRRHRSIVRQSQRVPLLIGTGCRRAGTTKLAHRQRSQFL